jgi:hypothetical protein
MSGLGSPWLWARCVAHIQCDMHYLKCSACRGAWRRNTVMKSRSSPSTFYKHFGRMVARSGRVRPYLRQEASDNQQSAKSLYQLSNVTEEKVLAKYTCQKKKDNITNIFSS